MAGRRRRSSLRARITIYATLGSILLFTAGAVVLYRDLTGQLSRAIDVELSIRLDGIQSALATHAAPSELVQLAQAIDADGTVVQPAGERPFLTPSELARARTHRIIIDREVPGVGEHARLLAEPLPATGRQEPVVGVAVATTRPLVAARRHLAGVLYTTGPALSGLVAVGVWFLAGAVLRPVRQMTRQASTISMTATGERLEPTGGHDEIAELGSTLNEMLARIEQSVAHERSFIDNAAHELRTPLAVLRGELELAGFDVTDEAAVKASLASALEETDRLARLTTDLLTLARADSGELEPRLAVVDIEPIARAAATHLPMPDRVRLEVLGEATFALADPDWVTQIMTNLLANATRYAETSVRATVNPLDGHARLVVADDGPGFTRDLIPRVFDRFTRGDDARERAEPGTGFGLGLAICATLVHAQGGTIEATNGQLLTGACVVVELPGSQPGELS